MIKKDKNTEGIIHTTIRSEGGMWLHLESIKQATAGITAAALLVMITMTTAYAQTLSRGATCNCIIDLTTNSSGHYSNNITGLTIPKVKLLKNETLLSQTEGRLSWQAIKSTQLMGILMNGIFLGNFTGTGRVLL